MCMIGQLAGIIDVPEEEPIYALRKWIYDRGSLYPAYRMYIYTGAFKWETNSPTKADCYHCDGPSERCSCGLYGTSYYEGTTRWSGVTRGEVYGVIKMWGRIAVHREGYRAEYAQPVATTRRIKGIPKFSWWQWKKKVNESRTRARTLIDKALKKEMEVYYKELSKEGEVETFSWREIVGERDPNWMPMKQLTGVK